MKTAPQRGEVIAAAKGGHLEDGSISPAALKMGERILFGECCGDEIRLSGDTCLIRRRDEIIRVLGNAGRGNEEASN